jgi:hypothetical protein
LDPFELLHEDVHEFIYHHLEGKEVINLFLVSPKWNRRQNEASAAMAKIKFVFNGSFLTGKDPSTREVNAMLQSQRKYRSFKGIFKYSTNIARKLLLLQRFSESLVEMKFFTYGNIKSSSLPSNLNFPKLKSAAIRGNSHGSFVSEILKNAPNIEMLSIESLKMNADLVKCLMQKTKLKELKIDGNRTDIFQFHSMQDCKFKLTSLSFSNFDRNPLSPRVRSNFENFMIQMTETLTHLKLSCFKEDFEFVLEKFPKLTSFSFDYIHGDLNSMQLKPNTSIKKLSLSRLNILPIKYFACFTVLEEFNAYEMTTENFEWIVRNMKQLKKLKFRSWTNQVQCTKSDIEKRYNILKAEDPMVNQKINILIGYNT